MGPQQVPLRGREYEYPVAGHVQTIQTILLTHTAAYGVFYPAGGGGHSVLVLNIIQFFTLFIEFY